MTAQQDRQDNPLLIDWGDTVEDIYGIRNLSQAITLTAPYYSAFYHFLGFLHDVYDEQPLLSSAYVRLYCVYLSTKRWFHNWTFDDPEEFVAQVAHRNP